MANLQTNEKKSYFIPLELTPETVITEQYKDCEVCWSKIGCRKVRTILIPATEEQYRAYMRPLWREDKRQQRHGDDEVSVDKLRDEFELEPECDFNLEEIVLKKELLVALRRELAALQDIERTILLMAANGYSEAAIGKVVGLSQKAVNKRKHKLYALLQDRLKDYR
jgi:DNA-binding CsgD family transcriptional regulator